ncbi:MAG: serine hydrolase [Solirubrobacteraceae bacterium]
MGIPAEVTARVRLRRRRAAAVLLAAAGFGFFVGADLAREGTNENPASAVREAGSTVSGATAARRFAAIRQGRIAFSITDSRGGHADLDGGGSYVAASTSKVLLLAADLDRALRAGEPVADERAALLSQMIRESDNDAANEVYADVGDPGMRAVARKAGMDDFLIGPTRIASCRCAAVRWARAQVTANDLARLMGRLDRVLPARDAAFGRGLLASVIPSQRWGTPQVAEPRWRVLFKNGVRITPAGVLVHQAARLEGRDGRVISLAVLTDGSPSEAYGHATVRGIAQRLLNAA